MSQARLDVVGIGNAIVDVVGHVDDDFLVKNGMAKGRMLLIDEQQADAIYSAMGPSIESSGGSAANTMTGVASFGGKAGYIGKIRDDLLGKVFSHDILASGVIFSDVRAKTGPATARSLILVTSDAQRTMNTFLGACADLGPDDVDPTFVASGGILYLEGYLFDRPLAQRAFHKAAGIARDAGRRVSLSLSDVFCVDRHRGAFLDLVGNHVDILFSNDAEIAALFKTGFRAAIAQVKTLCDLAVITRGAEGSLIVTKNSEIEVSSVPIHRLVDTTGAGDLYAAGFLFGVARGDPLAQCGYLGSLAASEIIGHFGGRPAVALKTLLA